MEPGVFWTILINFCYAQAGYGGSQHSRHREARGFWGASLCYIGGAYACNCDIKENLLLGLCTEFVQDYHKYVWRVFVRHWVTNPQRTSVCKYIRLKNCTFSGTQLKFCLNSFKDRKSKGKRLRSSKFGELFVLMGMCMYMYVLIFLCVCMCARGQLQMHVFLHLLFSTLYVLYFCLFFEISLICRDLPEFASQDWSCRPAPLWQVSRER